MDKKIMLVVGAGQISLAITRRLGTGKKILIGDLKKDHAEAAATLLQQAGFDAEPATLDVSSRNDIRAFIEKGQSYGPITGLINGAGVSPSQASIETILKVDLYGTAVLLEEAGQVIAPGVIISSQSGHRMPALTAAEDRALAMTPAEELLQLPLLQTSQIRDTLHAYQLAKRCNEKRVMYEAVR